MSKELVLRSPTLRGNEGFTIIELLISMSIILLLGGGVLAAFNNFNENQKVKETALTLKSNLRLAQNKAIAGKKPEGCGALNGFTASFTASSYTVQARCDGVPTGGSLTTSLPSGISFVPVPAAFTFSVLTGRIASNITLTVTGLSKSYSVAVTESGNVSTVGF